MAPSVTPYNRRNALASRIASDLSRNIAGKVIITTGVSPNGLGAKFAEEVAKHKPALLVLAGRSASKLQATADTIKYDPKSAGTETRILILNLASQEQIRRAAKEVLDYPERAVDVLVNSAGVMAGPYATTADGIELQFGANHIGHFLFTNLILPKLLASSKTPRIVNVSSDGHRLGPVRFTDWNFQDGKVYDPWEGYGQSKSANILFTYALKQKLGERGLLAYSLHPGTTMGTSLAQNVPGGEEGLNAALVDLKAKDKEIGDRCGADDYTFDIKTLDECAATHVVAAFDPRIEFYNGQYLENGNLSDDLRPTVKKPEDVEKLWELSEKLVGQKFQY